MSFPFNKVFVIGENKTGTTSLHHALARLGLRSLHFGLDDYALLRVHFESARRIRDDMYQAKAGGRPMLEGYEEYDAFLDIAPVYRHFDVLDRQYPGSKFIYPDRDDESWVESRRKHVLRNRIKQATGEIETNFLTVEPEEWLRQKREHRERVERYFRSREADLLIINIVAGDGYHALCPFLGLPVIDEPFPRKNVGRLPPEAERVEPSPSVES